MDVEIEHYLRLIMTGLTAAENDLGRIISEMRTLMVRPADLSPAAGRRFVNQLVRLHESLHNIRRTARTVYVELDAEDDDG